MEFTEGTVNLPVAGKVKKRYVAIPAGIALAYVTYRWWQTRQDQAEADPASDGTYTTDDLSEYGLSTTGGSTTVTGNTGNTVTDGTGGMSTNAEWTQKAVELLTNAGYDGATVYAALGEFLARRSLDKTEATIARAALAAAGQPPVGGPFSVIESAATGNTTLPAPTGVKVTATTTTTATIAWNKVPGAGYYRVYRSGASTNVGATDAGNSSLTVSGLEPNTTYTFYVAADTTSGKPGPKSAGAKGKTKAVTLGRPTGLKASAITRSSFRVTCSKVANADYYRWYIRPAGGAWRQGGSSDQPYRDFTGLSAGRSYQVKVAADTTNQTPGPESAPITVKTKK